MNSLDHDEVARAFGRVLKELREAAAVTQEELASRASLDRTTPSLYERGLRQPTMARLIDLANALGVQPTVLVELTVIRISNPGERT